MTCERKLSRCEYLWLASLRRPITLVTFRYRELEGDRATNESLPFRLRIDNLSEA